MIVAGTRNEPRARRVPSARARSYYSRARRTQRIVREIDFISCPRPNITRALNTYHVSYVCRAPTIISLLLLLLLRVPLSHLTYSIVHADRYRDRRDHADSLVSID